MKISYRKIPPELPHRTALAVARNNVRGNQFRSGWVEFICLVLSRFSGFGFPPRFTRCVSVDRHSAES